MTLFWTFRKKQINEQVIKALIPISILLITYPLFQVLSFSLNQVNNPITSRHVIANSRSIQGEKNPDIFLFVLDAYARADSLKILLDYDNSYFLDYLRNMGFYIADCSQSNYNSTLVSIASILNMNYLDTLPPVNGETRPAASISPYIKHSIVRDTLESKGYKIVAFETGFGFTEITDAEIYYQSQNSNIARQLFGTVNAFELLYLRTTAISALLDMGKISPDDIEIEIKRDRQEFVYSTLLKDINKVESPKFVFAHILTTHLPFANPQISFNSDPVVSKLPEKERGYHDALVYSDKMMVDVLEEIISSSEIQPVIIITGDHGTTMLKGGELDILYAAYLGGRPTDGFYSSITPVNTFRIVMNSIFSENFPLLPDNSYLVKDLEKRNFMLRKNTCVGK